MIETDPNPSVDPDVDSVAFGDSLRQARERLNLSREDAASRLNLKPQIVTALEMGDYQQLPSVAFVKGYIRAYAKLLGIDAQAFIKSNSHFSDQSITLNPYHPQVIYEPHYRQLLVKAAIYIAIGVLAIWLWTQRQQYWSQTEGPESAILLESIAIPELESTIHTPYVDNDAVPDKVADWGTSESSFDSASDDGITIEYPMQQPTATELIDVESTTDVAETVEGQHSLLLTPDAESWIEITDGNDAIVYYGLAKKGEVISVHGQHPFDLVIGNAQDVFLQYQGASVDLIPHTRNGVARLSLGDDLTSIP